MSRHEENNKIRRVDWNTAQSFDNTEYLCFQLTARQAMLLLSQTEYFAWRTRWLNLPALQDLKAIRAEIDYRLMTPVECEAEMTFALRMNGCDLEYTNNGVDWSLVENWDLSACIASDTTIINLGDNITTIENDITNIENNITNINTETTLITQNINNIVDGVGGLICLFNHVVATNGENNIEIEINDPFEWLWIEIDGRRNNSAQNTLLVALNDDTAAANYDSAQEGLNNRGFATIVGTSADSSTIVRIMIHNPAISGEHKLMSSTGVFQSSAAASVIAQSNKALIWKNDSVVSKIALSITDGLLAGSNIRAYGMSCTSIELDETPEIGWTIELEFVTSSPFEGDDHDEIVTIVSGQYSPPDGYAAFLDLELIFDLQASVNILQIVFVGAVFGSGASSVAFSMVTPTAQPIASYDPFGNGTPTKTEDINETGQSFRLLWELDPEFPMVTRFELHRIRFSGSGTIPSALVPYQI